VVDNAHVSFGSSAVSSSCSAGSMRWFSPFDCLVLHPMDSFEPRSRGDKNAASNEEHDGQFRDAKKTWASAGSRIESAADVVAVSSDGLVGAESPNHTHRAFHYRSGHEDQVDLCRCVHIEPLFFTSGVPGNSNFSRFLTKRLAWGLPRARARGLLAACRHA
jgi:hypothetical protein